MIRKPWLIIIAIALSSTAAPPNAVAQNDVHSLTAQAGDVSNPHTSRKDAEAGAKVFRAHCATCHGRNAKGFRGPNLTTGRFRHGSSDARIFRNVLQGIPSTGMGGIYLPDTQVWQVITYVRSLSGAEDDIVVPGNADRGRKVFAEKADCTSCHMIDGAGGRRGSNLSLIGYQRSIEHLREAIMEPGKSISSKYRFIQVEMKKGEAYEGILLNEDTYTIQMMDANEKLVSIAKKDTSEIVRPDMSLMPDYAEAFTSNEVNDLIAYLHSLGEITTDE
jgi:putative heme-binding domain-containing protein